MPRLGLARGEKEKIELEIAAKKNNNSLWLEHALCWRWKCQLMDEADDFIYYHRDAHFSSSTSQLNFAQKNDERALKL